MEAVKPEKGVPKQRLTRKQKGFVKDYVETGNGALAARKNYDVSTDLTARVIASENLTKPNIINAIQEALPEELLARKHLEGLEATSLYGKDAHEHDDYATRARYLDMAYKLRGSYAAEKHLTVNVDVKADPATLALAEEFEAKLKEKYGKVAPA